MEEGLQVGDWCQEKIDRDKEQDVDEADRCVGDLCQSCVHPLDRALI